MTDPNEEAHNLARDKHSEPSESKSVESSETAQVSIKNHTDSFSSLDTRFVNLDDNKSWQGEGEQEKSATLEQPINEERAVAIYFPRTPISSLKNEAVVNSDNTITVDEILQKSYSSRRVEKQLETTK